MMVLGSSFQKEASYACIALCAKKAKQCIPLESCTADVVFRSFLSTLLSNSDPLSSRSCHTDVETSEPLSTSFSPSSSLVFAIRAEESEMAFFVSELQEEEPPKKRLEELVLQVVRHVMQTSLPHYCEVSKTFESLALYIDGFEETVKHSKPLFLLKNCPSFARVLAGFCLSSVHGTKEMDKWLSTPFEVTHECACSKKETKTIQECIPLSLWEELQGWGDETQQVRAEAHWVFQLVETYLSLPVSSGSMMTLQCIMPFPCPYPSDRCVRFLQRILCLFQACTRRMESPVLFASKTEPILQALWVHSWLQRNPLSPTVFHPLCALMKQLQTQEGQHKTSWNHETATQGLYQFQWKGICKETPTNAFITQLGIDFSLLFYFQSSCKEFTSRLQQRVPFFVRLLKETTSSTFRVSPLCLVASFLCSLQQWAKTVLPFLQKLEQAYPWEQLSQDMCQLPTTQQHGATTPDALLNLFRSVKRFYEEWGESTERVRTTRFSFVKPIPLALCLFLVDEIVQQTWKCLDVLLKQEFFHQLRFIRLEHLISPLVLQEGKFFLNTTSFLHVYMNDCFPFSSK